MTEKKQTPRPLYQARFSIECIGDDVFFDGFADGRKRNEWACPFFTFEQAKILLSAWRKVEIMADADDISSYNKKEDAFHFFIDGDEDIFTSIERDGQKLYPIGAGSWAWVETVRFREEGGCLVIDRGEEPEVVAPVVTPTPEPEEEEDSVITDDEEEEEDWVEDDDEEEDIDGPVITTEADEDEEDSEPGEDDEDEEEEDEGTQVKMWQSDKPAYQPWKPKEPEKPKKIKLPKGNYLISNAAQMLQQIVSKTSYKAAQKGVYFNNRMVCATDGHAMVVRRKDINEPENITISFAAPKQKHVTNYSSVKSEQYLRHGDTKTLVGKLDPRNIGAIEAEGKQAKEFPKFEKILQQALRKTKRRTVVFSINADFLVKLAKVLNGHKYSSSSIITLEFVPVKNELGQMVVKDMILVTGEAESIIGAKERSVGLVMPYTFGSKYLTPHQLLEVVYAKEKAEPGATEDEAETDEPEGSDDEE